jgi:hypothetical protein
MKTIRSVTGQTLRMGRLRPPPGARRLRLMNYAVAPTLPTAPPSADYWAPSAASWLANVLGNDQLGDCTAAGAFHVGGALLASAGGGVPFSPDDVIKFYSATTGYVPGDPSTDQGGDEQTVLNYWKSTGLTPGAHQIAGWVSIDATNWASVQTALYLFENLYFGVELPDAWINPFPGDGATWDVAGAPDPENGHCFVGLAYDQNGVTVDTWGRRVLVTRAAVVKYAGSSDGGELYSVLSQDSLSRATQRAPNDLDWEQLTADLATL